jgi:bifunctional DNA-binding transcriptional regulator/antitoxin component of YhaV-PrlF toxin-antitoxin module
MDRSLSPSVLSVGQNGQITIPVDFRREHKLSKGAKVVAVRMGDSLVLAPHDPILEAFSLRLQEAMRIAGVTGEDLKAQVLVERAKINRERYGANFGKRKSRQRR